MGSIAFRNRFWFYRSLYDDYWARDFKLALGVAGVFWLPAYYYGVAFNRTVEDASAHQNYFKEYYPRRQRLTFSLCYQEFEKHVEQFVDLEEEMAENGGKLKVLPA